MANERMNISVRDGSFTAYVSRPGAGIPAPAVVVIQEIFGVNEVVRAVADRLSSQGFLAVAPDLFWRIEPGVDITDRSKAEWDKAFALMKAFDTDKAVDDIQAVISQVREDPDCSGRVGVVGHCLGGRLAFLSATRTDSDGSVGYYGVSIEQYLGETEKLTAPLMLHIAEEDGFTPKPVQQLIIGSLSDRPGVEIHTYPGRNHAFARPGGEHWDADDAAKADQRTLSLLKRALR